MWYYWLLCGFVAGAAAAALFFRINPKYLGNVEWFVKKLEAYNVKEKLRNGLS